MKRSVKNNTDKQNTDGTQQFQGQYRVFSTLNKEKQKCKTRSIYKFY